MSSSMHVDQSTTTTVNWAQREGAKSKIGEQVGEIPGHEITLGPTGSLSVTNKTSTMGTQQIGQKEAPIVSPKPLTSRTITLQQPTKLAPQTPTSRTDQVGTETLHLKNESNQINRIANQLLNQGFSFGLPTTTPEKFIQQQFDHLTKDAEPPFTKEQAIGILKNAVHLSAIEPRETMKAEGQIETVKTPAWAEAMLGEINKLGISEDKNVKAPHTLPLEERVSSVAIDKLSTEKSSFAKGAKKVLNAIVTPFKAMGRGIAQLGSKISKAVSSHFEQREIQSTQKKNRELIENQGQKWEIDDVHGQPKLFAAMEKFAQSKFQGEVFTFIRGVKDLQNVQDPATFKQGLENLFDKSILGKEDKPGSSHQINIYPEHQKQLEALKNQDINPGNLSEVKTKLDSLMKEVLGAESMWSREIVGNFRNGPSSANSQTDSS